MQWPRLKNKTKKQNKKTKKKKTEKNKQKNKHIFNTYKFIGQFSRWQTDDNFFPENRILH